MIDVLKDALTQGGFQVYYQPIWSVEKQCFTLAESLLRLPSTPLGPLYPSEFIPIAEETGLIVDITYYVLDTVCRFVHDLLDSGITMLESVTVNFSGVQFSQHNPAEKVISIIESHGIPYRMIKIEITESVLAESRQELEEFIDLMHAKGVEVSLDDFGTGYCNLVSVLSMDVDVIKLDKSLLWAAQKDQKTAIMMKSLSRSVHELGMRVVSEGVETDEQRAFAEECCCDWIQGYYFAKPMPGEDAKRFLAERIEKT